MKQFVKALHVAGDCYKYNCREFPKFGMDKLKSGLFVGLQIIWFMKNTAVVNVMTVLESEGKTKYGKSLVLTVETFLGKVLNYEEIVQNMLTNFKSKYLILIFS